jgi:hypothetical protein
MSVEQRTYTTQPGKLGARGRAFWLQHRFLRRPGSNDLSLRRVFEISVLFKKLHADALRCRDTRRLELTVRTGCDTARRHGLCRRGPARFVSLKVDSRLVAARKDLRREIGRPSTDLRVAPALSALRGCSCAAGIKED